MPTRAQVWISSWNSPSLLYILQSWIALFASCRFRTKFSRSDFHREGPVNSSTGPAATLIYTLPHIFFYRLVQDHKVSIILSQYKSGLNCNCTRGSTRYKGFYAVQCVRQRIPTDISLCTLATHVKLLDFICLFLQNRINYHYHGQ